MTRTETVLLTNDSYLPNTGGVQNSLYHMAGTFRAKGYRVIIVTSDKNNHENSRLREIEHKDEGVILRYRFHSNRLLRIYRIATLLSRLKGSESIFLVISRSVLTSLVTCFLFPHNNIYIVPSIQGKNRYVKRHFLQRLKVLVDSRALRFLQRVVIVKSKNVGVFSEMMRSRVYNEYGRKDVKIFSPGVSPNRFSPHADENERRASRRRLKIPEDRIILLVVSRLAYQKRIDMAIEAMSYVTGNFDLIIVGGGNNEKKRLEILAKRNKTISSRVCFFGETQTPEDVYRVSDIFLLPSEDEPFGQTLIEAMACGLPIVAFDPVLCNLNTAVREVCPNFALFLADDFSPRAYATAIEHCNKNKPGRHNLSRWAHDRYSWRNLIDQVIETVYASKY